MQDFRKLEVWRRAHQLTLAVYAATKNFPRDELFGLTSQLRRGAVSIGSNIAEGCGRESGNELCRYLQIGIGSGSELEYQLLLARDLGYLPEDEHRSLEDEVIEVKRMLAGLIRKVRAAASDSGSETEN